MKIFSNFDTRLDKKSFLSKIEKYWDWNVLLIKRHPLFLYKAFLNAILAFILLLAIVAVIYFQYVLHIEFFYIFLALHFIWVGLWIIILLKKIISNLRNYKEFINKKEDLEKIDISQFWSFLKYSVILFFYQLLVSIWNILTLVSISHENTVTFWWWIAIIILNVLFLFTLVRILKKFIDFEMDFMIVTKDEIESFNQTGIFKREIISLDIRKIRSISTQKDWFLKSLFNIWSLLILSEASKNHKWEIRFNYIHRLWKLKKLLTNLINKSDINND